MNGLIGHVDGLVGLYVHGWALPGQDGSECVIEIVSDAGVVVGRGRAQHAREDLAALGLGRTDFGFKVSLDNCDDISSLRILADGIELPNSPLLLRTDIVDGYIEILEDRVIGWACRRRGNDLPIEVTIRTLDGLASVIGKTFKSEFDSDPRFQPHRFDVLLPECFFNRKDLILEAMVGDHVFAQARGRLTVVGFIDVIAPDHCAGWFLSPEAPSRALKLEIWRDNIKLGLAPCNRDRGDLKDTYPDNWRRGFHLTYQPSHSPVGRLAEFSIRLAATNADLLNGPFIAGPRSAFVLAGKRLAALTHSDTGRLGKAELGLLQNVIHDYLAKCRHGADFSWTSGLAASASLKPGRPITILIPIYKGIEITDACIRSVLANYGPLDTVILIGDCPPEAGMQTMLTRFRESDRVVVLNNESNLGFVGSVNRGLEYAKANDILLLNSDTFIHSGGIEQMRQILHMADDIATVTALSNNATIFSYPHPSLSRLCLEDISWRELAEIALSSNAEQTVDVPTGHGFCMLVRREVLDRLKTLNEMFGRGYGEENELCLRASDLGFRHVAAIGVLVEHRESVSFGSEKEVLISRNLATLNGMYPEYTPTIMDFEVTDPLRIGRWPLDIARLRRSRHRDQKFALIVENWLGGGTVKASKDIASLVGYGDRDIITMKCDQNGMVTLTAENPLLRAVFSSDDTESMILLLNAAVIDLVVIHQLLGYSELFISALTRWMGHRKSFFYGHDFYAACPRVTFIDAAQRFCGAAQPDVCQRCREYGKDHEASMLTELNTTDHRELFSRLFRAITKIIVPSKSAEGYFSDMFPEALITTIPHPEPVISRCLKVRSGHSDNVIVLGGIGPHKGSKQLFEIASQARLTHQQLTFTIVGHTDMDESFTKLGNVEILGRYDPTKLSRLLDEVGGRIALFTSCWPETFSYTLSEAVHAGLVPMVPDIGAPAERVRAASYGVVIDFPIDPLAVLDAIVNFNYDAIIPQDAQLSYGNSSSIERLRREFGSLSDAPTDALSCKDLADQSFGR